MSQLNLLYNELIKEHNKKPRNYVELADADHKSEGFNPLCGDHIWLYVKQDDGKVQDIGFQGQSCAICQASASIMTTLVKGQPVDEASNLIQQFRKVITGHPPDLAPESKQAKYMAAFAGISGLPSRVKCAVLPWHTLQAAFDRRDVASTEGDADPVPGSGLANP